MLVLGVLPSALVIRRQPEDLGLRVDGASPEHSSLDTPPKDQISAEPTPASGPDLPSPDEEAQWVLRDVLRTPSFWLLLFSLFAVSTTSAGVTLHLVPYLSEKGLSSGSSVTIISIFSASGAAATVLAGFLSERISPRLIIFLGYLLAATAMVVLIIIDNLAEAYLFAVLQGAANSGINVLAPILMASYYGRSSMGSIFGITRAGQVIGFALGALISGVVYDSTGSYQDAFILFVIIAVASSLFMLLARRPLRIGPTSR